MKDTYNVGDRVFNKTFGEGTVVYDDGSKRAPYAVEFDNFHGVLHDCGGHTQKDHGYWVSAIDVTLIEEKPKRKKKANSKEEATEKVVSSLDDIKDMFDKQIKETKKFEKEKKSSDNDILSALNKIVENSNKQTMYEDAIKDSILKKVKEMPMQDLVDEAIKKLDEYIKNEYGVLPKKIEVVNSQNVKQLQGLFHNKFEEILNIVQKNVPLMLTGPAGAGKNHTLEQVAQALELDFYFSNAITQEYKLTGFIDANGVYQETQFYKAFKNGGLFFLDEIDASCPESLITLNSAIANGYFDFPNGRVDANDNFRVVCAGNTFGTGADMIYVGRNALDGATLDRFATIEFDYDENIERQLAFDDELFNFIKELRNAIKVSSLRYIVSMRATINATKLLEIGMDKKSILKSVILKNMSIDDLNTIVKKIRDNSSWKKELERLIGA